MDRPVLEIDDTPVWRIKKKGGVIEPALGGWYSELCEEDFLTSRTFGTKQEADMWLEEFWSAYWRI